MNHLTDGHTFSIADATRVMNAADKKNYEPEIRAALLAMHGLEEK